MGKKFMALSLLALLSAGTAGVAEANLIVNGSFEDTSVDTGRWGVFNKITGWQKTSGPGIEIQDHAVGDPFDGSQLVELDSHANSSMEQTIATILDEHYTLSFAYSPRQNVAATSNTINVYWAGSFLYSLSASGIGNSNTAWTVYNFDVTGKKGALTSLVFSASGTSESLGGYLDAVSLTANPVPEPATLLLFGAGLAGLAGVRLRKKK